MRKAGALRSLQKLIGTTSYHRPFGVKIGVNYLLFNGVSKQSCPSFHYEQTVCSPLFHQVSTVSVFSVSTLCGVSLPMGGRGGRGAPALTSLVRGVSKGEGGRGRGRRQCVVDDHRSYPHIPLCLHRRELRVQFELNKKKRTKLIFYTMSSNTNRGL